jgi:hypothetical protein
MNSTVTVAQISGIRYSAAHSDHHNQANSGELVQENLRHFEVGGVEALGEPAVNGCQQIACFRSPALFAPQPGEARRGAQFQRFRLLLARDLKRLLERG